MNALLISVSQKSVIAGAQSFFPEAKVGNLKDPEKIRQKQQEHAEKLMEEAAEHSLYGSPRVVELCVATLPESEDKQSLSAASSVGKLSYGAVERYALPDEMTAMVAFLESVTDVRYIMGPHPTTESRLLRNAIIRAGVAVPKCLHPKIERWNPFHELCTAQEGEYPGCLAPLGLRPSSPIDDTIKMIGLLNLL